MAEKRYSWLKLMSDFFSQPKMKKLRRLAGGDTYTIIYLKMQLLSLNTDGVLEFQHIEDDFMEELALTLDESTENVSVVFNYLIQQKLIEELDNEHFLLTETQFLIGSESAVTKRVRKHREKQKALQCNNNVTNGNAIETKCNIEKEEEIDIEKDKEIEKDIEVLDTHDLENRMYPAIPMILKDNSVVFKTDEEIQKFIETYNDIDVVKELKKMSLWLESNPSKRKTAKGLNKFIVNWFNRTSPKEEKGDFAF